MTVRRAVLFGTPALLYLAGMLHPTGLAVGADADLFIAVHLALPVLVCLLGWTLWLLVDGVDNRAATVARALVLPFAVAYTVFTTFDGISIGVFVEEASGLAAEGQPAAGHLIGLVSGGPYERPIWLVAIGFWLTAVLAIVVALRRRAPLPGLVLLAVGAVLFARSHVEPWGPAGMAAFLAGVVWIELHAARASSHTPIGYDLADDRPPPR